MLARGGVTTATPWRKGWPYRKPKAKAALLRALAAAAASEVAFQAKRLEQYQRGSGMALVMRGGLARRRAASTANISWRRRHIEKRRSAAGSHLPAWWLPLKATAAGAGDKRQYQL
jgi:hypothetical protein